jgi:hypothetical protein
LERNLTLDDVRRLTLEPDARMKEWPGGTREFAVEIAGEDGSSRRIAFEGGRVAVNL